LAKKLATTAGLKMISDLMNNFQISLFEGPKRLINFTFPSAVSGGIRGHWTGHVRK
jgi:hypothetical protein